MKVFKCVIERRRVVYFSTFELVVKHVEQYINEKFLRIQSEFTSCRGCYGCSYVYTDPKTIAWTMQLHGRNVTVPQTIKEYCEQCWQLAANNNKSVYFEEGDVCVFAVTVHTNPIDSAQTLDDAVELWYLNPDNAWEAEPTLRSAWTKYMT